MAFSKVQVSDLAHSIVRALDDYTEEVQEAVGRAVIEVGKETAADLKQVNRVGNSNVWKKYPLGWKVKNTARKGRQIAEVHNATEYRLTHLLENGHVIKNQTGKTFGRTREFPHIITEEKKAVEALEKKIKELIG